MLTRAQENYLQTIPEDKIITISPYDPKTPKIADKIIQQIKSVEPDLEIRFMGASALGISGQGDLDIYVFSPRDEFEIHSKNLEEIFGEPIIKGTSIKWTFFKEGHEIELYITDPSDDSLQEQIKVFELLKNNKNLLQAYRLLKEAAHGLTFREYQRRKYEFYNKILAD